MFFKKKVEIFLNLETSVTIQYTRYKDELEKM